MLVEQTRGFLDQRERAEKGAILSRKTATIALNTHLLFQRGVSRLIKAMHLMALVTVMTAVNHG
jgi:hypothetical protein